MIPLQINVPPKAVSLAKSFLKFSNSLTSILQITNVADFLIFDGPPKVALILLERPFKSLFTKAYFTAVFSMSTPSTYFTPRRQAAMAKIPDPVPRSIMHWGLILAFLR